MKRRIVKDLGNQSADVELQSRIFDEIRGPGHVDNYWLSAVQVVTTSIKIWGRKRIPPPELAALVF
ncbi:hypothetical protein NJ76_23300 [Rhodococcus sp. IITR03]|nr:hypothetical protein NJ76_23300 [Rhodococcus sp. IITR03]